MDVSQAVRFRGPPKPWSVRRKNPGQNMYLLNFSVFSLQDKTGDATFHNSFLRHRRSQWSSFHSVSSWIFSFWSACWGCAAIQFKRRRRECLCLSLSFPLLDEEVRVVAATVVSAVGSRRFCLLRSLKSPRNLRSTTRRSWL
jgi:hypothetical protein